MMEVRVIEMEVDGGHGGDGNDSHGDDGVMG